MAYSPIEQKYLNMLADSVLPPPEAAEPSLDGMQLAAGPSDTRTDAPRSYGSIRAIEPTKFEKALQSAGIGLEQAGRFLDGLGRVDVPGLGEISLADMVPFVGSAKPGTRSAIQVWRRGSMKDMHITVGEFEADKPVKKAAAAEKPQAGTVTKVLGLTVSELSDAQKKELKLRGGVRVDAVAEPASRAGIQEGDVILALANIETPNVQTLEALTAKLDRSKPVSLLIRRGEWAQYTVIRPVR
mgnify:CR=1 FL=1